MRPRHALLVALAACGRAAPLTPLRLADAAALGSPGDRIELVPAFELPLTADHQYRTRIVLSLPPGGGLRVRHDAPEPTVVLPVGASLDRVETWEPPGSPPLVADVRGTEIAADGQHFHILRPVRPERGAGLLGWSWPANDPAAQAAAADSMAAAMREGAGFAEPLGPGDRAGAAAHYLGLSDCLQCHGPNHPAQRSAAAGGVWRPSDGNGWYSLLSTLRDDGPLEAYRPDDPNVSDPHVSVFCERGSPAWTRASGRRHASCPSGDVPFAHLDVLAGRAAGNAHVAALCASRRSLWARFDADGRTTFRQAFVECGLPEKTR